jgi:hypothetical protein
MVLTGVPILFPEGMSLSAPALPVTKALRSHYRLIPISTSDSQSLKRGRLLLMAQPRAQPPEDLVALDEWVRKGGRVLLLADPSLDWPSERPLGDPARPPYSFADTGLLAHWGLRLESDPARLSATSANCRVERSGVLARCYIGSGAAAVIPDADFLAPDNASSADGSGADLLIHQLTRLEGESRPIRP